MILDALSYAFGEKHAGHWPRIGLINLLPVVVTRRENLNLPVASIERYGPRILKQRLRCALASADHSKRKDLAFPKTHQRVLFTWGGFLPLPRQPHQAALVPKQMITRSRC